MLGQYFRFIHDPRVQKWTHNVEKCKETIFKMVKSRKRGVVSTSKLLGVISHRPFKEHNHVPLTTTQMEDDGILLPYSQLFQLAMIGLRDSLSSCEFHTDIPSCSMEPFPCICVQVRMRVGAGRYQVSAMFRSDDYSPVYVFFETTS